MAANYLVTSLSSSWSVAGDMSSFRSMFRTSAPQVAPGAGEVILKAACWLALPPSVLPGLGTAVLIAL